MQTLSWIVEEERERIRKQQCETIDLTLQNGIRFGRPTVSVSEEFKDVYKNGKVGN